MNNLDIFKEKINNEFKFLNSKYITIKFDSNGCSILDSYYNEEVKLLANDFNKIKYLFKLETAKEIIKGTLFYTFDMFVKHYSDFKLEEEDISNFEKFVEDNVNDFLNCSEGQSFTYLGKPLAHYKMLEEKDTFFNLVFYYNEYDSNAIITTNSDSYYEINNYKEIFKSYNYYIGLAYGLSHVFNKYNIDSYLFLFTQLHTSYINKTQGVTMQNMITCYNDNCIKFKDRLIYTLGDKEKLSTLLEAMSTILSQYDMCQLIKGVICNTVRLFESNHTFTDRVSLDNFVCQYFNCHYSGADNNKKRKNKSSILLTKYTNEHKFIFSLENGILVLGIDDKEVKYNNGVEILAHATPDVLIDSLLYETNSVAIKNLYKLKDTLYIYIGLAKQLILEET